MFVPDITQVALYISSFRLCLLCPKYHYRKVFDFATANSVTSHPKFMSLNNVSQIHPSES